MERHIDNAIENKVILTIENKKILKNLLFSATKHKHREVQKFKEK